LERLLRAGGAPTQIQKWRNKAAVYNWINKARKNKAGFQRIGLGELWLERVAFGGGLRGLHIRNQRQAEASPGPACRGLRIRKDLLKPVRTSSYCGLEEPFRARRSSTQIQKWRNKAAIYNRINKTRKNKAGFQRIGPEDSVAVWNSFSAWEGHQRKFKNEGTKLPSAIESTTREKTKLDFSELAPGFWLERVAFGGGLRGRHIRNQPQAEASPGLAWRGLRIAGGA
jgi:hypothetical protein